jgi:hypothetical protein
LLLKCFSGQSLFVVVLHAADFSYLVRWDRHCDFFPEVQNLELKTSLLITTKLKLGRLNLNLNCMCNSGWSEFGLAQVSPLGSKFHTWLIKCKQSSVKPFYEISNPVMKFQTQLWNFIFRFKKTL